MRLARIARADAIYDASAAARNFASNKPGYCDGRKNSLGGNEEGEANENTPKPSDFEHIPGYRSFMGNQLGSVNKVNLS